MLTDDSFKKLVIGDLKLFCKNAGIKNYSKLKKKELFEEYNRFLASVIIQKYYREFLYRNATDCITLEKVNFPCFIYRTKFGKTFFYNHDSIIRYIMKTGNTRDPMTRNQYTDEELARLDSEAKIYFPEIKYRSTLKIKKNENYALRIINRENEILSFQTRLSELKEIILNVVVSDMLSWDIGPLTVDNIEYRSVNSYINSTLNEFKLTLLNLKAHDSYSGNLFQTTFLENLKELNCNFILQYISSI
jgi:hypothetical protein